MNSEKQEEIRDLVVELWNQEAHSIHHTFGLGVPKHPASVIITKADTLGDTICLLNDSVLQVSDQISSDEMLLKAVVARECMRLALPKDCVCDEWIEDVANEYARESLPERHREKWMKIWKQLTPKTEVNGIFSHDPTQAYLLAYELNGEAALKRVINDLQDISRYGIKMDLEDYLNYFFTIITRLRVPLDRTELIIIDSLAKNPNTSPKQIAEKASLSSQWISTKITELQKRQVLRKFEIVRFSKIGIRMFHLTASCANIDSNPQDYLASCPFLYGMRRVLSGQNQILATLAVPNNPANIESIHKIIKILEEDEIKINLFEVKSSGYVLCFDHYDPNGHGWNIPWDIERIQLRKIHKEKLASLFPRVDERQSMAKRAFDSLDIKILGVVWRKLTSVSRIRKELHVGQERAATKLKELRDLGIISTRYEVHNIGLDENVFVFAKDPEVGASIGAWALRFPRSIISYDDE